MNESSKIFQNRAEVVQDIPKTQDCTSFECCHEELVFAMQDTHHQFSLGLSTVLECLAIAEKDGFVPKLPEDWWIEIRHY